MILKTATYICYLESLCNSDNIYTFVLKNIYKEKNENNKVKNLDDVLVGPKTSSLDDISKSLYYLENGFTLVLLNKQIYVVETKEQLDRGVTISQTEPNMYGSKDSFCENYQKNLGLIKIRIKNNAFKVENINNGNYTKTKIGFLYLEDQADEELIKYVKKTLIKFKDNEMIDSNMMCKELEKSKIFPTIFKTEKPAIVVNYILKGYVIILIDNTPFALILDAKLNDFINLATTDKFLRVLRVLCFIVTISVPAIYIALINYNQETIPTSLLINFSEQRSGVPFPAIIEAIIMLFVCEILREADIRFPSNYGSSASILGALILGDTAVAAGVVSPILKIMISITFISNLIFTETNFVYALRIVRSLFLIIASFFGLYGISLLIILLIAYLTDIKLFKGSYV